MSMVILSHCYNRFALNAASKIIQKDNSSMILSHFSASAQNLRTFDFWNLLEDIYMASFKTVVQDSFRNLLSWIILTGNKLFLFWWLISIFSSFQLLPPNRVQNLFLLGIPNPFAFKFHPTFIILFFNCLLRTVNLPTMDSWYIDSGVH